MEILMKSKMILIVFLCSMIPIIELRGAIPLGAGTSEVEWIYEIFNISSDDTLPWWLNYIICVIGNMLPVPFILLFIKSILNWMKRGPKLFAKIAAWLENKANKHSAKFQKSESVALMLFVGIPLPGTGAWSGTLAASILDMDFKSSILAVMLGVILAGIIMGLASSGLFGAIGAVIG